MAGEPGRCKIPASPIFPPSTARQRPIVPPEARCNVVQASSLVVPWKSWLKNVRQPPQYRTTTTTDGISGPARKEEETSDDQHAAARKGSGRSMARPSTNSPGADLKLMFGLAQVCGGTNPPPPGSPRAARVQMNCCLRIVVAFTARNHRLEVPLQDMIAQELPGAV